MSTLQAIPNFDVTKDVDTLIVAVHMKEKDKLLNILCYRSMDQRMVKIKFEMRGEI